MSREQSTLNDSGLGSEAEQLIEVGITSQERRIWSQDSYIHCSNAQELPEKDELLDSPVSQRQASDIYRDIVSDWWNLGMQLGLKATELDEIDLDHSKVHNKASAVIFKWQQKNGRKATLRILVSALLGIGRNDLSDILLGNRRILQLIAEIPRSGAPTDTIFCKDLLTAEDYIVKKVIKGRKQEPIGDEELADQGTPVEESTSPMKSQTVEQLQDSFEHFSKQMVSLQSESATCLEKFKRELQSIISSGRTVEPAQESQEEISTEELSDMVLELKLCIQRLETAQSAISQKVRNMQKEEKKQKKEKIKRELKATVANGPQRSGYSPSKGTYDETTDTSSTDSNPDPAEDTRL